MLVSKLDSTISLVFNSLRLVTSMLKSTRAKSRLDRAHHEQKL